MLDLQTLAFKVDTAELDQASKKIEGLGAAIVNLEKPMNKLAITQEKLAQQQAKTAQEQAKVVDAQNKAAISQQRLNVANERAVKTAEKQAEATEKAKKKADDFLASQIRTRDLISDGYTRGEANVIKFAEKIGLATDKMHLLKSVLGDISGLVSDPFDAAIGSVRSITREFDSLSVRSGLVAQGIELSNKQLREYGKLANEVTVAMKRMGHETNAQGKFEGKSLEVFNKTLADQQTKYLEVAKSVHTMRQAEKDLVAQHRETASAKKFLIKEDERMKMVIDQVNQSQGLATSTSERVATATAKYAQALRSAGIAGDEAKKKLDNYKTTLAQVEAVEEKRRMDRLSRSLAPQISDVTVGLASGQSLMTVMLQQGLQIRDLIGQSQVDVKNLGTAFKQSAADMVSSLTGTAKAMGSLFVGALQSAGKAVVDFGLLGITNVDALTKSVEGSTSKLVLLKAAITAVGLGVGIVAASLVAAAVAFFQVSKESDELAKAMATTGGSMAMTADSAMAYAIAMEGAGIATNKTLAVISEMSKASGLFAKDIEVVTKAAVDMEKYAGVAIEKTVKIFSDIKKDPVDALVKFAEATGQVSSAAISNVIELEKQGRKMEAIALATKVAGEAHKTMADTAKQSYSALGLTLIETGDALAKFFDKTFRSIWREKSPIEKLKEDIEGLKNTPAFVFFGDKEGTLKKMQAELSSLMKVENERRLVAEMDLKIAADRSRISDLETESMKKSEKVSKEILVKARELMALDKERLKASPALKAGYDVRIASLSEEIRLLNEKYKREKESEKKGGDKKVDPYINMLENAKKLIVDQTAATLELTKAEEWHLKLQEEADWKKLSQERKDMIASVVAQASAQEKASKASKKEAEDQEFLNKIIDKSSGYNKDYSANLKRLAEIFDEGTENYKEYSAALLASQPIMQKNIAYAKEYAETILKLDAELIKTTTELDQRELMIGRSAEERKELDKIFKYKQKLAEIESRRQQSLNRVMASNSKRTEEEVIAEKLTINAKYNEMIRQVNRETAIQAAEEYVSAFEAIQKIVSDGIATALIEGGEEGLKKFKKDLKKLVIEKLSFEIDAQVNILMRGLAQSFGFLGGDNSQGGGLANITKSLSDMSKRFNEGVGSFGKILDTIGTSINSPWLSSFGKGMGMTGEAARAAQVAGQGASLTSAQGATSIGSSVAAFAPWAAMIIAGMMGADSAYKKGFSQDSFSAGSTGLKLGVLAGGGPLGLALAAIPSIVKGTTNLLEKLGVNSRLANVITGASLWGKAFGRGKTEVKGSGLEGTFGPQGFSGNSFTNLFQKGGWFRSDKSWTEKSNVDTVLSKSLSDNIKTTLDAAKKYSEALGKPAEALNSISTTFKLEFTDDTKKNEEMIEGALQEYRDALFAGWETEIADFIKNGESISDTVGRVAGNLLVTNDALRKLGWTALESSVAGGKIATTFVEVFGGVEEMLNALDTYNNEFYSEQERLTNGTNYLKEEFAKLGRTMPTTREGFRAMVESAKSAGDPTLVANLIQLAPAFAALVPATDKLKVSIDDILSVVDQMGSSLMDPAQFRDYQISRLQDKAAAVGFTVPKEVIEGATRTGTLAVAMELYNTKQYDALAVLLEMIPTLEQVSNNWGEVARSTEEINKNLAALKLEGKQLSAELLKAQGNTEGYKAAIRALAIEGLSPAEVAEWDRNQAIRDTIQSLNEAAETEKRVAQEREGLETRLLQLQGNTAELRRRELAQLDPSNRAIQLYIWALEDAQTQQERLTQAIIAGYEQQLAAVNEALSDASAAVADAQGRISSIREQARNNYLNAVQEEAQIQEQIAELAKRTAEEQRRAAQEIADAYKNLAKTLLDYVRGIVEAPKQSFGRILTAALGGDQEAMQKLPEAATGAIEAARGSSVTGLEFRRQQAKILADVLRVQKLAESMGVGPGAGPVELTEEQKLQQQLVEAQNKVAQALAVANAVGADTSATLDLIAQYNQALLDLATAEAAKAAAEAEKSRLEELLEKIQKNTEDTVTGIGNLSEDIAAALESVKIDVDGVINLIENSTGLSDWVKQLLMNTTSDILRDVIFVANEESLPDDLKLIAMQTSSTLVKTIEFLVGSTLPDDLKMLASTSVSTLSKTINFIAGSTLDNDLKEIALKQSDTMTKTVQAVLASDTTDAVKRLVLDGTGDYLATVKAIASPTLTPELQRVLFNQAGDYITTIKAIVDSSVTPENKQLLLTGNSTVNKSVQLQAVMNSVLTTDQKAVLNQVNENVTKTIAAAVSTGSLTEDQKAVLTAQNESVNKIVNALVNDSSLTAEQKKYLNLISGSTNSTVTLQGSVTFDPSQPLMSIFNAILETNKRVAETNKLMLMQLTGGNVSYGADGSTWYTGPANTETPWTRPTGSAGFAGTYQLMYDQANYLEEIRDVLKASGGLLVKFARGASAGVDVYAKGGAFTNGIVSSPTMFNNSMMGEAGPEAIMPLSKMPDGSLGVRTFTNEASDDDGHQEVLLAALIEEVKMLRAEVRADVGHNAKTARILDRVTRNGEVMLTEEQPVV